MLKPVVLLHILVETVIHFIIIIIIIIIINYYYFFLDKFDTLESSKEQLLF